MRCSPVGPISPSMRWAVPTSATALGGEAGGRHLAGGAGRLRLHLRRSLPGRGTGDGRWYEGRLVDDLRAWYPTSSTTRSRGSCSTGAPAGPSTRRFGSWPSCGSGSGPGAPSSNASTDGPLSKPDCPSRWSGPCAKAGSPPPDSRRPCRPALAYVDALVIGLGVVPSKVDGDLTGQFSDEEILELTYIATLYLAHAVAAKALRLEDDNPASHGPGPPDPGPPEAPPG